MFWLDKKKLRWTADIESSFDIFVGYFTYTS